MCPMHNRVVRFSALSFALSLMLQGCSMAPNYKAPFERMPDHYREQSGNGAWHPAQPADKLQTHWWEQYQDSRLDELQQQLLKANPSLTAALARFDAAQAYASQLHAGLFPQISASAQSLRQRQSDHRPLRGDSQTSVYNSNTTGLSLDFDLDLWGRIRNQIAAGDAQAQASADDLAAARLSLQHQLTTLYLQVRGLDAQKEILMQSLDAYGKAVQLTRDRFQGQIASELDMARAQTQLAQAKTQMDDVCAQRNLGEHAIAELVGELPSNFRLAEDPHPIVLPTLPASLPSSLLQRRPDIAGAERRMFAANANIGVVRAAWYPDFSLTALLGGQTQGEGNLLSAANRYWALGPLISLPLFDGGRRNSQEAQAKAQFDEAAAHYHEQVLQAVREVEDSLGQLRDLQLQAKDEQDSFNAARIAEKIATDSYQAGAVSYLNVVTAQTAALQAQQALQIIETRRLQGNANLMFALGGGWSNS